MLPLAKAGQRQSLRARFTKFGASAVSHRADDRRNKALLLKEHAKLLRATVCFIQSSGFSPESALAPKLV